MKSIKEKADEKYPTITWELQTYNKKFVEGADYVLNQIESLIKYNRWSAQDLYDLIEQLKSNQ